MIGRKVLIVTGLLLATALTPAFGQSCDPPKCGSKSYKKKVTWDPRGYKWQKTGSTTMNTDTVPAIGGGTPLRDRVAQLVDNYTRSQGRVRIAQRPTQCAPPNRCFCLLGATAIYRSTGTWS